MICLIRAEQMLVKLHIKRTFMMIATAKYARHGTKSRSTWNRLQLVSSPCKQKTNILSRI